LWQHYSSWRDPSLRPSVEESLAELVAVPLLVRELALWQQRSLQAEVSQASSVSAVAVAAEAAALADPDEDDAGRH